MLGIPKSRDIFTALIFGPFKFRKASQTISFRTFREHSPSSSVGTSLEAMDLIAMNDVPFKISTIGAVRENYLVTEICFL
jgi:hypothetical protein